MTYADMIQEATRNRQALLDADRERAERASASEAERERARRETEAALRARRDAQTPEEVPSELPSWGVLPRGRELARFLFLQKDRTDGVGRFARMARADASFPTDPTAVIRYLAVRNAPSEALAAARELIREYRTWWREGFEAAITDLSYTNRERGLQVRERHLESMKAVDFLYAEDRKL